MYINPVWLAVADWLLWCWIQAQGLFWLDVYGWISRRQTAVSGGSSSTAVSLTNNLLFASSQQGCQPGRAVQLTGPTGAATLVQIDPMAACTQTAYPGSCNNPGVSHIACLLLSTCRHIAVTVCLCCTCCYVDGRFGGYLGAIGAPSMILTASTQSW